MDIEEMTLEEVIETLQVWISTADDEYDREEHGRVCGLKEALHEIKKIKPCTDAISRSDAIRVASGYCHWSNIPKELAKLPSVNPIPCEDAISRKAVLEGLARIAKAKAKSDAQKAMMGRAMFFIERMPSVSTEKTGRWEEVQFRTIPYNRISKAKKCSVCGKRKDKYVTWNYCPSCGARMVESQESEE